MRFLHLRHRFTNWQLDSIEKFLMESNFTEHPMSTFIVRLKVQNTRRRYDPDQLIVKIYREAIQIEEDYACYRGRWSILGRKTALKEDAEDEEEEEEDEQEIDWFEIGMTFISFLFVIFFIGTVVLICSLWLGFDKYF